MANNTEDVELRKNVSKMCEGISIGVHGEDGIDYIMRLIQQEANRQVREVLEVGDE